MILAVNAENKKCSLFPIWLGYGTTPVDSTKKFAFNGKESKKNSLPLAHLSRSIKLVTIVMAF